MSDTVNCRIDRELYEEIKRIASKTGASEREASRFIAVVFASVPHDSFIVCEKFKPNGNKFNIHIAVRFPSFPKSRLDI